MDLLNREYSANFKDQIADKLENIRVLLVEDEVKTAKAIKKGLEENKITVDLCYDGINAGRMFENHDYDVVVLDIIIPGKSGIELCSEIRLKNKAVPILLLTALGSLEDKVTGFESGADDYLVKPFEFRELLARIKSLARRSKSDWKNFSSLTYADLKLDLDTRTANRGGKKIVLTAREFSLLEYLMRNKEKVVSKNEIAQEVWSHYNTSSNIVEVYMNYLRNKVDRDFEVKLIHTTIGMGYILKSDT